MSIAPSAISAESTESAANERAVATLALPSTEPVPVASPVKDKVLAVVQEAAVPVVF